jgi:CheY-like chemotaxis protein/PAS domain-containing protein
MSAGRILNRVSLGLAGAALLLSAAVPAGLLRAGIAAPSSALLAAAAALLALAASVKGRVSSPGGRMPIAAAPPARAALGPALDGTEAFAIFAVEPGGRVTYANAGAARLFGRPVREMEGAAAGGILVAKEEERAFLQEIGGVVASGRFRPGRRTFVTDEWGRRVEAVRTLLPLLRYGKTVEVAVVLAELRSAGAVEREARLLDATPVALVGLDGEGRIEAANERLSEWTGRRMELLEGMEVARADILPPSLRESLDALARNRPETDELSRVEEFDETLLPVDGPPRPVHVIASTRSGGGADVVLFDGSSRLRILADLEAARSALAEAREAAAEAIEATTNELRVSVEEVADAVRRARDDRSGPLQRAKAEADLAETTREFLRRVEAVRSRRTPSAPRVLLVEDNEDNRDLLAHMLHSRGAEVVVAGSGAEAVDAASRQAFSFVLLDLQMPEMDGYQVLRRLRALPDGGALPVVALTALASETVRRKCEAEGMSDFVTKPVTLARIGELVDRWGARPA